MIALLDTGASRSSNVIESVSMLGGSGDDDNGHGEAMVKAITKENKKAQIISIKVLDKNGEGSVSSIVSGIAYAEKRGASIVNLSLSGLATEGNAVVTGRRFLFDPPHGNRDINLTSILLLGLAVNNNKRRYF